ncbi:MAG: eCIS core domain-containing protein [Gemmatimonadales bacterium]
MSEPLSSGQCDAIGDLPLPVDYSRVRLYRSGSRGLARATRGLVLWLSRGRAVALGNHVFLPRRCDADLAVLAHELTHCAQYQAWGWWRYFGRGAAAQLRHLRHRVLGIGESPYAYRLESDKPFEAYGMEQQGQIVEDLVRRRHPPLT